MRIRRRRIHRGGVKSAIFPLAWQLVVHRHSDGNPLFMTAMLDHMVQPGMLSSDRGPLDDPQPPEQVDPGVPETLRQMLEIQLRTRPMWSSRSSNARAWPVRLSMRGWWARCSTASRRPTNRFAKRLPNGSSFSNFHGTRELADGTATVEYQFRHALYREILYRRLTPEPAADISSSPRRRSRGALWHQQNRKWRPRSRCTSKRGMSMNGRSRRCCLPRRMRAAAMLTARPSLCWNTRAVSFRRSPVTVVSASTSGFFEKIGNAYYALGDMKQSAITYEEMATHAAENGLLQEQADALMRMAHPAESIPFFPSGGRARCEFHQRVHHAVENLQQPGRDRTRSRVCTKGIRAAGPGG